MIMYPHFNPVAVQLGPFAIHWYGLMYLFGFCMAWLLLRYRLKKFQWQWSREKLPDLIFYSAMGVIIGGRVGYMLVYNFPEFIHAPWTLFKVWDGGMSFHGGMVGVFIAIWLWCRRYQEAFFKITDFIAPVVPIGLAAGRLGNFINGELWGRVTTVPWGMIYPDAGPFPRHPSELYEFFLEGIVLFIVLWVYSARRPPRLAVSGAFLVGYGVFRFFCEFFRTPDVQLGFLFSSSWFTMGQLLCIPMIILGIILLALAYQWSSHHGNVS